MSMMFRKGQCGAEAETVGTYGVSSWYPHLFAFPPSGSAHLLVLLPYLRICEESQKFCKFCDGTSSHSFLRAKEENGKRRWLLGPAEAQWIYGGEVWVVQGASQARNCVLTQTHGHILNHTVEWARKGSGVLWFLPLPTLCWQRPPLLPPFLCYMLRAGAHKNIVFNYQES